MTRQTDRTGLIFQLLISLNKLTNATGSRLLDFPKEESLAAGVTKEWSARAGQEPLDPHNRILSIREVDGLDTMISQQATTRLLVPVESDKTQRVFYRIDNDSNNQSILLLDHNRHSPGDEQIVLLFLEIFKNLQKNIQAKDQDPLTGLFNRRSFDETISHILDHAIYGNHHNRTPANGACLAIFDIDFFKRINDNHGHAIGDEVLILFGRLMERIFRQQDRLYRFGGEEFLAILTEVDINKASQALERFRLLLEEYPFPQVGTVTVSVGATMVNREEYPPVLIEKADQALYHAKGHGRNQVHFHENLVALGLLKPPDHASDNVELWG